MSTKTFFYCSNCGYKSSKWLGKCPECDSWNTFVEGEETVSAGLKQKNRTAVQPVSIGSIPEKDLQRFTIGISEMDRVLGGIVPGQAMLLSGEPGIGKSTLLLALADRLAAVKKVIYVNGEESGTQVRIRAGRIGAVSQNLLLLSDCSCEGIEACIRKDKPDILIIDSIQTLFSERFSSLPGSVVQVRESAFQLVNVCKELSIPLFLVGHITKSGSIAGPKVIEHIVDTVLFLETDARGYFRILRSLKNRFFTTEEVGFFTMEETGLKSIDDVSSAFTYPHESGVKGVGMYPHLEGNRVFPVEVQALCSPSQYNYPRRTADGMDINRLGMLLAILEKSMKITLAAHDIYVNVTNGLTINDPGLDLAVLSAVYSSFKDIPVPLDAAVFGEAGLTGEVRPVLKMEKRAGEMARMGFTRAVLPCRDSNASVEGIKLLPVKTVNEALQILF